MKRPRVRMTFIEAGVALGIIVTLAAILLPGLAGSREAARRSSCANNLKQMALMMKMYANEWNGYFPPLSRIPNNWMIHMRSIYPEYLTDLSVLICPSSPFADYNAFGLKDNFDHPGHDLGQYHPDCVSSLFYIYTGYTIFSDEQALALFGAYYEMPPEAFAEPELQLAVPVWADSDRVYSAGWAGIPVLWDRVPLDKKEFAHRPLGGNVLHMDGHVQFVRYSYYNNSNFFPITRVSAETFGSVFPRLSSDCYWD